MDQVEKRIWAWLYIVYASHLALFDEPYIKPQEIALDGLEEMPKPI